MGAYLSEPKRDKESEEASGDTWRLGASSMQGWRVNMEDAHLVHEAFGGKEDTFLIGVFDGHGGPEVAKFVAKHLGNTILESESYKSGKVEDALKASFLQMDDYLFRPYYRKQLKNWKKKSASAQNIFQQIVQLASNNEDVDVVQALTRAEAEEQEAAAKDGEKKAKSSDKESITGNSAAASSTNSPGSKSTEEEESDISKDLKDLDPDDEVQAGCTAVVAWRQGSQLLIANAGDSRAVLCRNGKAVALSTDHKPELPGETSRIKKAFGYIENGRVNGNLNLSRAIGDLTYKKNTDITPEEQVITADPEITSWTLQDDDDFLILGCDGIWEIKTNQEIVDYVKERLHECKGEGARPLSWICEQFMDSILSEDIARTEGMGCDNMTMIIIELRK
ncbi:unnamed protein product [Amoebophrya sp. A25]|nr:unnamed protein product [Amoebophrya sp. A25]|eukprot:GSA25T00009259001.1